jgi:hypothetical protein
MGSRCTLGLLNFWHFHSASNHKGRRPQKLQILAAR